MDKSNKMRIYVFKWSGGEKDWVFAPTMKEAKEFYIKLTECGDLDGCKIEIVPKKDWENHYILDIEENEPDPNDSEYNEAEYFNGYKIIESFAEYSKKNTSIDLIATTEF